MVSWRNIKWDGHESLHEFLYRVTQPGQTTRLNDQLILDTFKLGLPSNVYVYLVHIDGMKATLNVAKRHMAVSKGTLLGASGISNIPFMASSNNDGLGSGLYQNPDIPKQVTFKIQLYDVVYKRSIRKLTSIGNDSYALRVGKKIDLEDNINPQVDQTLERENWSRDSSRDSLDRDRNN